MANQSDERLEHLARELAALTPEDRDKVLVDAARFRATPVVAKFTSPSFVVVQGGPAVK